MLDFFIVATKTTKNGLEVYPKFLVKRTKDLMIRGGEFYAVWNEDLGLWSTSEFDLIQMIDRELDIWYEANKESLAPGARVLHMWDSDSGSIDRWNKYCQSQMRDNFVQLDDFVTFSNTVVTRTDYRSKRLPYPLVECETPAWDKIVGTLYDEEERHKIEWAIGSIFAGKSTDIQKFMVFYGAPGSGKSTILNIIQMLFGEYSSTFVAKDLTSSTNAFCLEAFKNNPLVSIEHDGQLSRIEDNTKLNSLVSHEYMTVNEKYKSVYTSKFRTFLFIGTNKPVKITDSKSGILRRLIDVHPSGNLIPYREYNKLMKQVEFELGGIAMKCMNVFTDDPDIYNEYIPIRMMDATNDFYNFLRENFYGLSRQKDISLKDIWEMYKAYCQEANVPYVLPKRVFREELKTYFKEFYERNPEGRHQRDWYKGFLVEKFPDLCESEEEKPVEKIPGWVNPENLIEQDSLLDIFCSGCKAQYATEEGTPRMAWDNVQTKLRDLDTHQLHYLSLPEAHIVIDCDIKDADGNKDINANMAFAQSLPPTYCEMSKGGGLHCHYIYAGDPSKLADILAEHIEIKKFTGKQAIRRKLTRCNNLPIATISSGLPLKGEKRVVNISTVMTEDRLRKLIEKNIRKEIHPDTTSSIHFIKKLLDDAQADGLHYDLRDMENTVQNFAARSSNQASHCLALCLDMKFYSGEEFDDGLIEDSDAPICFFDVEIFPNLFILCNKLDGEKNTVVKMINPDPSLVREFIMAPTKKIGFNCRRYDNHIIYAYAFRNYSIEDLYILSGRIINSRMSKYFFGEAYNISYTDIYDFASAGNKKSLKKLEIEMGIHHKEFPHPWNEPLAEEYWEEASDYCANDVVATEAAFYYLAADWKARLILADIAKMSPNNTTNQLTTKIIFGSNKMPQNEFNYRDLSKPVRPDDPIISNMGDREYRIFDNRGQPTYQTWHGEDLPKGYSLLPFFPGYKYDYGKSIYMDTEIGEGGYVYAEPGMYRYISLLDVASMHPSSIIAECLFGPRYTAIFKSIVDGRLDIKHGDFDEALKLFEGALEKWLKDADDASGLADALKTAINSAYGLTSAKFENPFRDIRNIDNIVAKRGALFMRTLQEEVAKRGFHVVHIKTDSIKIPGATDELIEWVIAYGKEFGYTFEYEAQYDCMTLVNDAVYIARYDDQGVRNKGGKKAGQWTATGKQFAVPYVFKTLFTHEELTLDDLTEVFTVKETAIYMDMNQNYPDVSMAEKQLKKIDRDDPANDPEVARLKDEIAKGHNYIFVGRVGCFCPVSRDAGGALYRRTENKYGDTTYAAVQGTTGYYWADYEVVKELGYGDKIDYSYFDSLAKKAMDAIENYGSFDWFVNHDVHDPYTEILPF